VKRGQCLEAQSSGVLNRTPYALYPTNFPLKWFFKTGGSLSLRSELLSSACYELLDDRSCLSSCP
jgi:hypothetical protein